MLIYGGLGTSNQESVMQIFKLSSILSGTFRQSTGDCYETNQERLIKCCFLTSINAPWCVYDFTTQHITSLGKGEQFHRHTK